VPPLHCTSSRGFASSSLLLKKAKPSPSPKPVKGKARAAEPSDESAVDLADVLEKTKGKMVKAVEWAKGVLYDGVERGRGRVSPGERILSSHLPDRFIARDVADTRTAALLDGVKVTLPDTPGLTPLNAVASVTVKSNSLFIEVWDTDVSGHTLHISCLLAHTISHHGKGPLTLLFRRRNTSSRHCIRQTYQAYHPSG
jgi:ribosome recycling factor